MRKLKWFTLVEILIVIVIIGILIWALVPRMQSAQGRARDVARKNDLSQIQSAIVTSYSDRGKWPALEDCKISASGGCAITESNDAGKAIIAAWLNWVPVDPIEWNNVRFQQGKELTGWYWYAVMRKNWVDNAWFILMAHTEVEWWSNRVDCSGSSDSLTGGYFDNTQDLRNVLPCTRLTQRSTENWWCAVDTVTQQCYYENTTQLRYILIY